jgi:hypothetical protein
MISKLANPNSRAVKIALQRTCPLCDAQPGERCVRTTKSCKPRHDQPLTGRVVHIGRAKFRSE